MRFTLDRDIAYSAGVDAANVNMRHAGRKKWNDEDYNIAVKEMNRLLDIIDPARSPQTQTEEERG